jgi:Zn-dependent protease
MSGEASPEERERHLQNLHAVLRHHAESARAAPAASDPATSAAWRRRLGFLGPIGIALLFLLGKLKYLTTLLTMLVAVWVYALYFGLPFAVGFVLLIFVHELGHALVMRQQGIRAGAPVFIPFVGAVIAMKSLPRDAYVEALVGIGGPILGSLGAFVCLVVGWLGGGEIWYALGYTGFMLNLFNLIPISPLDGGRIVGVIGRWLWLVGYAIGIAVFLTTHSPILFLILLFGLFGLGRTLRGPRPGYFDVEPRKRLAIGGAYFALLALLALGMWVADVPLEPVRSSVSR